LHGDLSEDVYMTLPQGVNATVLYGKQNQVCCLTKSLYGFKQASK